ncbi:MAG: class I SAM-dependent methyltransferase [Bacteroidetes bacterium]|nr:class I SAM-dependent methyltransferase [Bacteroidota bacterium]
MSSERQDHNEISPWWGEHIHRYQAALHYLSENGTALDLACGNGFGTQLLSKKTIGAVIGGDISEETITYCRKTFKNIPNLHFEIMDGTHLRFENDFFNTIVSFETIEHTTKYQDMLKEFNRTLMKNGYALISTPNIVINSPTGKILNPYHTQEFTYHEFETHLKESFTEVSIYGQKYIRYQQQSIRNMMGQFMEKILFLRGVRKIPLCIQNYLMKIMIGKDIYPGPNDFELTKEKKEILKCKTFFAVCRKF